MRTHPGRIRTLLVAAVVTAGVAVPTSGAQAAEAERDVPPWQSYLLAPGDRTVPVKTVAGVESRGGSITAPDGLLADGGVVTRVEHTSGAAPRLVLDFGKNVSGRLVLDAVAASGDPRLHVAFSESRQFLSEGGDVSWGEHHPYAWTVPSNGATFRSGLGTYRYVLLWVDGEGSVDLDDVHLDWDPFLGTADTYRGWFRSSDDLLNKIWYAGVYTLELNTTEPGHPGLSVVDGRLRVTGEGREQVALTREGAGWADYSLRAKARIPAGGRALGFVLRAADAGNLYMWQFGGDKGLDHLRPHKRVNGAYSLLADVPVDLTEGQWFDVRIELAGDRIRTWVNDALVDDRHDASFAAGRIGVRQYGAETADIDDLTVESGGKTVFSDDFSAGLDAWAGTPAVILDGAKRDRAVWIGDLAPEARVQYLAHDDHAAPVRDSLADLADHQRPDGAIPPSSFVNYSLELHDYCAWWVVAFADYLRHTGDRPFTEKYWPHLVRQMAWFDTIKDDAGLIVKDRGIEWSWTLPRTGEVTYLNIVYYKALRDAAEVATAFGHEAEAAAWSARAEQVKGLVNEKLFDRDRGVYVNSDIDRTRVPQDANALAVVFGIAPEGAAQGILDYLKAHHWTPYGSTTVDVPYATNSYHDKRIWPFMGGYEVEARFAAGDDASALELLRREWGHMVTSDLGPQSSLWEWMTTDGRPENGYDSLAHGWSGGSTVALTERVLGVISTTPEYRTFDVVPHPGDLRFAEGVVPTPQGPVAVSWRHDGRVFTEQVTVPQGSKARLAVPTFGERVNLFVGGKLAWNGQKAKQGFTASSDGRYVYVEAGPGSYHLRSEVTE